MKYEGDIPDKEQYTPPATEAEVLAEELRLTTDRMDLQAQVLWHIREYQDTEILKRLMSYAVLSWSARVRCGEEVATDEHFEDPDFFAGELFAMHAIVSTIGEETRDKVTSYQMPAPLTISDFANAAIHPGLLDRAVEGMQTVRTRWNLVYTEFPDAVQEQLTLVIDRMFGLEEEERMKSFILGYSFGRAITNETIEAVR